MFVRAGEIARGDSLDCDVCIIGGGAAGVSIAREFARTKLDVVLLESGEFAGAKSTQALYEGTTRGVPQLPLDESRLRLFGGSTNHWAGMCRALDPEDFAPRAWIPHSGWPLRFVDLEPYYRRAHDVCGLSSYDEGAQAWADLLDPGAALRKRELVAKPFQFSNRLRFGRAFRAELAGAPRVRVILGANVRELLANESASSVDTVDVRSLAGNRFAVRARAYVLACGGIENARVLLLSNRSIPAGLGNGHDLVGRFFADHPSTQRPIGVMAWLDVDAQRFAGLVERNSVRLRPSMAFDAGVQKRERLLNHVIYLGDPISPEKLILFDRLLESEVASFRQRRLEGGDVDIARFVSSLGEKADHAQLSVLSIGVEPAPNPNSRVTLMDQLDALGQRKSSVDWQLSDSVYHTFARVAEMFAREAGASGIGRVKIFAPWPPTPPTDWWERMWPASHHIGTTRMADAAKRGVVDRDCRVFGLNNLYIAGSSVFPSSGTVNPTLTLVALALRLADHLAAMLH